MIEIFNSLTKKIKEYDSILIMSHKNTDLDGLASSIVLAKIARKFKKEAYIYINELNETINKVANMFDLELITANCEKFDSEKTLLIVVDTNSAIYVEEEKLLSIFKHVLVIDHHSKNEDYIQNTEISYVNSNLSSVIEFVVYYLKYLNFEIDENLATIMLAGLEIDTNSFNFKTTPETYRAAGILIEMGASPIAKQEILRESRESILKRHELLKKSYVYKEKISICVLDDEIHTAVELAQIADELLMFKNIEISFCLGNISKDVVRISARTLGKFNAQEIMSLLGGGGALTSAATNLECSLKEAEQKIIEIVRNLL